MRSGAGLPSFVDREPVPGDHSQRGHGKHHSQEHEAGQGAAAGYGDVPSEHVKRALDTGAGYRGGGALNCQTFFVPGEVQLQRGQVESEYRREYRWAGGVHAGHHGNIDRTGRKTGHRRRSAGSRIEGAEVQVNCGLVPGSGEADGVSEWNAGVPAAWRG